MLQAILFKEGKALGRLVRPRIATDACSEADLEDGASPGSTLLVELHYHLWEPATDKGNPQPLQILVDHQFKQATYSIKVFGQARGSFFPVPQPYLISGLQTAAAVSFAYQQQQYIRAQQLRWQATDKTHPLAEIIGSVTVACGMPLPAQLSGLQVGCCMSCQGPHLHQSLHQYIMPIHLCSPAHVVILSIIMERKTSCHRRMPLSGLVHVFDKSSIQCEI